ncbi:MAG: response regulator [Ignavibacteriaceae bacterium]|nr:response regulator [Ignavibacteriaceae bacterium]
MNEKDKILVVEDEKNTRYIFEKLLTKNGYEVLTSNNGEEALQALKTFQPKVILADWTMPLMDGLQLCNILKQDENYKLIYYIILTAKSSLRDRIAGLDIGADDFLIKPIENQELLARIRSGIRIFNLQNELKSIEHNKAIVELACTIGHNLNNPLSSLTLALENIKEEIKLGKQISANEDFDVIKQSLERIKTLVNQLTHLQKPKLITYSDDSKMIKLD